MKGDFPRTLRKNALDSRVLSQLTPASLDDFTAERLISNLANSTDEFPLFAIHYPRPSGIVDWFSMLHPVENYDSRSLLHFLANLV